MTGITCSTSCRVEVLDDLDELEVRRDKSAWALPVASAELNVADLIGDISDSTEVYVDENGQLHLVYTGSVLRKGAKEIFPPYPPGLPIEIPDSNTLVDLPFKELILTDMTIKGDSMFILFRSELEEDVDVKCSIPALSYNGQVFTATTTIVHDPNRSLPFDQAIVKVGLKGYRLQMDNNSYRVKYDARRQDGSRILLDKVILVYNTLDFTYMEGFFSKKSYDVPRDTIAIDVYDKLLPGTLFFEAPSVAIKVTNSFGFPMQAEIKTLRLKGQDGQFLDLESPFVDQGFSVDYPRLGEVGESRVTEFVFDTSNSNIRDIFNSQPVEMDYEISALANPDEQMHTVGFLHEDNEFLVNVRVDLPAHGRADQFENSSDLDIDLSEIDGVDRVELKWVSTNRIPVSLDAQLYFYDEAGGLLDSLFSDAGLEIEAAPVDDESRVLNPVKTVAFAEFAGARLDRLKEARTGRLKMRISTYESATRSVRILEDQGIHIGIGAIIETE